MITRDGKGLDFGRDDFHTSGGEYFTTEAYFWLPNPAFAAVEYDSILQGGLHQLPVMILRGLVIDMNIIMDGYDSGWMVSNLVHAHLKDILGHLQTKGHGRNWYLPLWVLKVVRYEDFSLRWTLQKPSLASGFMKVMAPLRQ